MVRWRITLLLLLSLSQAQAAPAMSTDDAGAKQYFDLYALTWRLSPFVVDGH